MATVIRLYDVEPRDDHPELPSWTADFTLESSDPQIGDELKISETDDRGYFVSGTATWWRVVRRTMEPSPKTNRAHLTLGVRYVSS